jgi:hypothetical protein
VIILEKEGRAIIRYHETINGGSFNEWQPGQEDNILVVVKAR